jgi:hypothetical protein
MPVSDRTKAEAINSLYMVFSNRWRPGKRDVASAIDTSRDRARGEAPVGRSDEPHDRIPIRLAVETGSELSGS